MKVKGIIMDLDDTLVLTKKAHYVAWKTACQQMNIPFLIPFEGLWGRTTIEIARMITPERAEELAELKKRIYREVCTIYAQPAPCVNELLRVTESLKRAIVTSSLLDSALATLRVIDMTPDVIISADMVDKPKPDPQPVFMALRKLSIDSSEVIAIGDSPHDMIAFTRAGLRKVFILKGHVDEIKAENVVLVDTLCEALKHIKEIIGIYPSY
ncbi:phosphoglucomutase [Sulfolobales archaeon HS-7]|nr:phosphoglucomutase [Sulfolobales archaeon HS-7]